ncbi:MAG: S49 family peptidase [Pseudomonadota bacterium]|nr:S49 family peptidase [Pseudomonadota bacterium]
MSEWPPNPDQKPSSQPTQPNVTPQPASGQEWQLLEKVLMSSVEEQRRARRWGIFFKLITLAYVLMLFLVLGRGCSPTDTEASMSRTQPHLAVIDIQGEIGGQRGVESQVVIESLNQAFSATQSQAVVLNINSPGGSPVQSDEIFQEIMRLREQNPDKKLYAVITDIGASGAYYIAASADEIWVNPSSLVGSIGVIMPNYGLEGLTKKLGVEDRTLTSGDHKAALSFTKPLDPFEKDHVQGVLNTVNLHFIDEVKAGLGDRIKDDGKVFSGLFWSGSQALELGLADKSGGLNALSRELDIENIANYTHQRNPLEDLAERLGAQAGHALGTSVQATIEQQATVELK